MRRNGVRDPTASEAARLRLLAKRLQEQRHLGDLDGAVETWLEIQPVGGARARPTKQERKLARKKMLSFFAGPDPAMEALLASSWPSSYEATVGQTGLRLDACAEILSRLRMLGRGNALCQSILSVLSGVGRGVILVLYILTAVPRYIR